MVEHDLQARKMSQSMYYKDNNKTQVLGPKSKGTEGTGGNFVRIEGAKFDIILNILIGIRRSLSTLVRLPGLELTDWQF